MQKNRKSRAFNFPHPLIKSPQPKIFQSTPVLLNNKLPPYSHQPFITRDRGNPCPHLIRPTTYTLLDNKINLSGLVGSITNKGVIQLGCIVQPFSSCCQNMNVQGQTSKNEGKIIEIGLNDINQIKCNNCGSLMNNNFNEDNNYVGGDCNICSSNTNKVGLIGKQNENELIIRNRSVIDFDLGSVQNKKNTKRILFIIERSKNIGETLFFQLFKENIKLMTNNNHQNTEIGFIIFDKNIYFLKNNKKHQSQPQLVVWSPQFHDIIQQVTTSEQIFINISKKQSINQILDAIYDFIYNSFQTLSNKRQSCFQSIVDYTSHYIQNTEILIFFSLRSINHQTSIKNFSPSTNHLRINEFFQYQTPQNIILSTQRHIKSKNSISFFVIQQNKDLSISKYSFLYSKTGGIYFRYDKNQIQQLYYDLYDFLSNDSYRDIKIQVRVSKQLKVQQIVFYQKNISNRSNETTALLNYFHPNSTFSIYYNLTSIQFNKPEAFVQILIYHSINNRKKVRSINFRYPISLRVQHFLENIGDQSLFFLTVRQKIIQLKIKENQSQQKQPITIIEQLTKKLKIIVHLHKKFNLSNFDFSIPSSLKFFCLYLGMLTNNFKLQFSKWGTLPPNQRFYFYQKLCNTNLQRLSKQLYMKMYRIDNIGQKYYQKYRFPKNLRLQAENVQMDGIYFFQDGKFLYIVIGEDVQKKKIKQIFGTHQKNQIINRISNYEQQIINDQQKQNKPINKCEQMYKIAKKIRKLNVNNTYLIPRYIKQGSKEYQKLFCQKWYNQDRYKAYLNKLI